MGCRSLIDRYCRIRGVEGMSMDSRTALYRATGCGLKFLAGVVKSRAEFGLVGLFRLYVAGNTGGRRRHLNQYEKALLIGFAVFCVSASGLFHFMVFRVNRQPPPDRSISHFHATMRRDRSVDEHKRFYPRSSLHQMAVTSAVTCWLFAIAFLVLRFWDYLTGK